MKHDVEILHTIGDFDQKETYIFDDKVINGIRTLIIYYKNSKNPIQNFIRRMKAYKMGFVKMQKPDVVHANVLHNNMLFAVYLKKKFKIPFVVTEHWTALRKINQDSTSGSVKKIAKFIGNQSSMMLPVSNDLKASLAELGITTPMQVIPNVVDTQLFEPNNSALDDFTFVHVSNLIPRKNADKILNVSIKLLKEGYKLKLKIGGDGETKTLREIVQKEGFENQIEVFDTLTLPEVSEKLKTSDCFILFSEDENQPCVIAESFASGIKVISTNVGGISEFFPDNFGILVERSDESLLENAMKALLNEKVITNKKEISDYAETTFSKNAIAQQFTDVYEEILN
ncbi:hypothetical protein AXA65_18845 [Chryseobacterium sp. FP211-J200]|nr:hypothetical protein AXA65_18845 [Chryseobacterium sp. FP211-J200]